MPTKKITRSQQQNKAIHLYCTMVAEALNDSGQDMRKVLRPEVDIPWTMETVKEFIWRPVMKAMTNKESSTELTEQEITPIWEVLHRSFSSKYGIDVRFPSKEQLTNKHGFNL